MQPLLRHICLLWLSALSTLAWPGRCAALVPLPPQKTQAETPAPRHAERSKRADADADGRAHFVVGPYLQDVRTDGIVVVWETDVTASGMVRLDLPSRRAAFLSPPGTHHEVRVSGLRPGTRYRYVVAIRPATADPRETRSESAEFATAPTSGTFTFLVYGDNRDRDIDHAAVIHAMMSETADFVLQTGDMTGNAGEEHLWRRYFAVAQPLLRNLPMYPVLGNHELRGDSEASHFYRYFVLPGAEDRKSRVVYYSFRYSNSLFLALDGNSPYDQAQAAWLERTLAAGSADPTIRHIFAFVHQPPYAVGAYCGSEREQKRFVPLFSRYRVRAIFGGHEHAYQHLERGGLRYFVSGGGGAPLYLRTQPCTDADQHALRLFRAEHHYLRVRIQGDEAQLTAINKSGEVMEQVALHQPVPMHLEESGPPQQPASEVSSLGRAALALPLAVMVAVAVATGGFMMIRPYARRRREDLHTRRQRN